MNSPSWVELMGRHAGSAALYLSGTMTYGANYEYGTAGGSFAFWHGPAQRWRVESDGQLVFIQDGEGNAYHADDDGELEPMVGDALMPLLGAAYRPFNVIPPGSLPYKISLEARISAPAREERIGGRQAWVTTFASGPARMSIAIDDVTAVVVRFIVDEETLFEVYNLVEHDSIDDGRFTLWTNRE